MRIQIIKEMKHNKHKMQEFEDEKDAEGYEESKEGGRGMIVEEEIKREGEEQKKGPDAMGMPEA